MRGTIYFVTAVKAAPEVRDRLKNLIPEDDLYQIAPDKWLAVFSGTATELAEKSGVRAVGDEVVGTGLVIAVGAGAYAGRGSKDMWDWLREKEA
jgi:hypothetical protein